jgi:RNA-dependent RNA polymerase
VDATEVAFEANFSARKLSFTVRNLRSDLPSSTEDVGIEEEEPLEPLTLHELLIHREKRSDYKMEFLLRDITGVREIVSDGSDSYSRRGSSGKLTFIVEVRHPPKCFCRAAEQDPMGGYGCHQGSRREEDEWSRTVDFTGNGSIGRSFCYVFSFPDSQENQATAGELRQKLKEFHLSRSPVLSQQLVLNASLEGFRRGPVQTPEVASFPPVRGGEGVPFHLMFQVQQLVQHGLVAESALARGDFFWLLKPRNRSEEQITERALKEMVGSSAYIFRPVQRLIQIRRKLRKRLGHWASFSPDLPPSLVSVRRLEVTPTKVLCLGPETAVANRVTRKLAGGDRLMRVTFRDEGGGQLSSKALQSEDGEKSRSALYYRMEAFLRDGFVVGNRRYAFLAFSTSQVREQAV